LTRSSSILLETYFIQTESTWRLKYEPLHNDGAFSVSPQRVITGTGNITAAEQNMAKEMMDKDKVYANKNQLNIFYFFNLIPFPL
jgi:hypothetical protein